MTFHSHSCSSSSRFVLVLLGLITGGCSSLPSSSDEGPPPFDSGTEELPGSATCTFPESDLFASLGKDVIPALTDPSFLPARAASYLKDDDRVLGFHAGGVTYAVPHNILKYHEIINLNSLSPPLAVTYCPLTGSGLIFDRTDVVGAEFGVSGLLYKHNLILYDRNGTPSFWPQMAQQAGCGPARGKRLHTHPVWDMTWQGWRTLFPATQVVSPRTGYDRDYTVNPYVGYDEPDSGALLYGMPVDNRRPLKERVLGIPSDQGGVALPFGTLDDGSPVRVVSGIGERLVVFWDRDRRTAAAYRLPADLPAQTFVVRDGTIFDQETDSAWRIDGCAIAGSLQSRCMKPLEGAHLAFWFAWAAFHPETALWTP